MEEEIKLLQLLVLDRYFVEQRKFYEGTITEAEYKVNRVKNVSLWYAKQLKRIGIATDEFDPVWIRQMAAESFDEEVALVSRRTTGLTDNQLLRLCEVQKRNAIKFFRRFHRAFCPTIDEDLLNEAYTFQTDEEHALEVQALVAADPDSFTLPD